ncbi:hypothetical protein [Dickeya sp. DW 0440]|uniref:hypothetical protein n=1 Tax=Dickeya sp. DW 0440 TaxID=1225785 RepID=UPI0003AB3292|nr:hypothetical protein [Dickeya sp. DW 0440]
MLATADAVTNSESFAYNDSGNGSGTLQALSNGRYIVMNAGTYQISATATGVNDDSVRWTILYPNPTDLGVIN